MPQTNDLSRSLVALEQDSTLIAVIEMSAASWLVGGWVPGLSREPQKKLEPDAPALLKLICRWRDEAEKAGRRIKRIVVAYEAGRDGFWLARWLVGQGVETYVIHSTIRAAYCGPGRGPNGPGWVAAGTIRRIPRRRPPHGGSVG